MKVHLHLCPDTYSDINFDEALEIATEHYAIHGDTPTTIIEASTGKVVNRFRIEDHGHWYTFEELIELAYYIQIQIIDACYLN